MTADAREYISGPHFGLHVVFTNFVRLSERKLNICLSYPVDNEPPISEILGEGADPAFDKILSSLGYIARHKPKPVIDSVMFWRKSKSEAAAAAAAAVNPQPAQVAALKPFPPELHRRNTEPAGKPNVSINTSPGYREAALMADRRNLSSIYVLCRVLIEVVSHISEDALGEELGSKLEEIVFNQLRLTDPESLQKSPIRAANWRLFSQLLGTMSRIRFASVSDQFVADLERDKARHVSREREGHVELVIQGMRYLQLRIYPLDALEDSADFLNSIATFFGNAHGQRIKHAYANTLNRLLLPLASHATAEVDIPTWASAINALFPKAREMSTKPKHWAEAFPLACSLLCVAPRELFAKSWLHLVEANLPRLKDRSTRETTVQCITRLVWVYLNRCSESLNNSTKKLDTIVKGLLFQGKKNSSISMEPATIEQLVQLVRFIGFKYPDYTSKTIILPLLNSDVLRFSPNLQVPLDQINPERVIIALRSFLLILSDLGHPDTPPPFPTISEEDNIYPSEVQVMGNSSFSRDSYEQFGQLLGKISNTVELSFGGQAALDDRLSQQPKTPVSATFSFGLDSGTAVGKQAYFDLLKVTFQALPRCIPINLSFSKVIVMLCRGTAHPDPGVAYSAAMALKVVARVSEINSRQVATGFARFIFGFDEKYSTTSETGLLGDDHVETTLEFYSELLQLWIDAIRVKAKPIELNGDTKNRKEEMETTSIWTLIEEIESNGLFFLCSQSRIVRHYAIVVLRLVTQFDSALDEREGASKADKPPKPSAPPTEYTRIINILDNFSSADLGVEPDNLSVAERSRLQKLQQGSNLVSFLIRLAESENGIDSALWFRAFPRFIQQCFERFPMTVVLCRNSICIRLLKMQNTLIATADTSKMQNSGPFELVPKSNRQSSSPELLIEQWKLYLVVACSTLTVTDEQVPQFRYQHGRKKSVRDLPFERITSARAIFQMVIPLLGVDSTAIREAVVTGLGCINFNLYRTLIEELQPLVNAWTADDQRIKSSRSMSSLRKIRKHDRMPAEVTHVFQLTSHFLCNDRYELDEWILQTLVSFVKDMKSFLSEYDVQIDWEYQKLRRWFCGLVETLFEGIRRSENYPQWLPFEGRVSLFRLIEEWCGHGQHFLLAKEREGKMRQAIHELHKDVRDRGALTASMEIEKRNLEHAALYAMASLCVSWILILLTKAGPVVSLVDNQTATMSFNVGALFQWIDSVLNSAGDRMQHVGMRALHNILKHNGDHPELLLTAISRCYDGDTDDKAMRSYFTVISNLLVKDPDYPYEVRQAFALGLFKIGDENALVRAQAAKLLKAAEKRFYNSSCLSDYEISVADKTTAVYKQAQYLLSARLAKEHPDQILLVFSEFTVHFEVVNAKSRRDLTEVLLPWVQTVELQLDPNAADLSPSTYMVLANLFEITIKYSDKMGNEVAALWMALATGPHIGNLKAALDFVVEQSLERRDPAFVEYGKQVLVFLGRTPQGNKLVEALLAYLQPRRMIPHVKEPSGTMASDVLFPHVADLSSILPSQQKQVIFSHGQLALILLVDLLIEPIEEMSSNLALLLYVVFAQFDHYVSIIQNEAREMLVHLIHELTIRKQGAISNVQMDSIAEFVENVRNKEQNTTWQYDHNGTSDGLRTPAQMEHMVDAVIDIFDTQYPNLRQEFGSIALSWAISCPVRHLACRSFQLFRCLMAKLDLTMLGDMLARLSNTISDESSDIQGFAMEILCTLNAITADLDEAQLLSCPQLFWTTVACLNTMHEQEFIETLSILEKYLTKLDFADDAVIVPILSAFPEKWEGKFDGLQALIFKGLRSSVALSPTLKILDQLSALPSSELVGGDSRLLYAVLANLPRFLDACEKKSITEEISYAAETLALLAESQGLTSLTRVMTSVSKSRFRSERDLLTQATSAFRESFFPEWEAPTMIFILGLLSNKLKWMKIKIMDLLKALLPFVDMRKTDFQGIGADLISPLLRLLQTDYAQQALEVLDSAKAIVGGPSDKQVMRMSLGSRSLRKEYENTVTLYGIPDESGWAVPMPAVTASSTRANVHAVFYTCSASNEESDTTANEIEFHMDDYSYVGSHMNGRTATMISEEKEQSGSLGEMVSTLHSLDVFFTEDVATNHHHSPSQTDTEYSVDQTESAPALYDTRVAAILGRTLARTPSVISFKTSLADSFGNVSPTDGRNGAMTPITAAFHSPPQTQILRFPTSFPRRPSSSLLPETYGEHDGNEEYGIEDDSAYPENPSKLQELLRGAGQISGMRARLKSSREGLRDKPEKKPSPVVQRNGKATPKSKSSKETKGPSQSPPEPTQFTFPN